MGAWGWRSTAVATAVLLAGCSVSSRDVVDEARARGGGLSGELVVDAVDAVAERQGTDSVALRSITVVFTRVALEVGVPPDEAADDEAASEDETTSDDEAEAAEDTGESGLVGLAGVEDVVVFEYGSSGRFGGSGLDGPHDIALSNTGLALGPSLFTLAQAGVERFDAMVATALQEADLDGGYAAGATIARPAGGGEPLTIVTVTDGGEGGEGGDEVRVTLGPDGRVLEVVA